MIETELKVHWGEMDSFEHVNNIYYFRYMESGRIEYFLSVGLTGKLSKAKEAGMGPILKKIECIYHRPVNYPSTLIVTTTVTHIGKTSLKMEQQIFDKKDRQLVAEGSSIIVMFDYEKNQTMLVSNELRKLIEAKEGKIYS